MQPNGHDSFWVKNNNFFNGFSFSLGFGAATIDGQSVPEKVTFGGPSLANVPNHTPSKNSPKERFQRPRDLVISGSRHASAAACLHNNEPSGGELLHYGPPLEVASGQRTVSDSLNVTGI